MTDSTTQAAPADELTGRILNADEWPDLLAELRDDQAAPADPSTADETLTARVPDDAPGEPGPAGRPAPAVDVEDVRDVDWEDAPEADLDAALDADLDVELAGAMMLTRSITRAAGTGEVLVTIAPAELSDNAQSTINACTAMDRLTLSSSALSATSARLGATLAHETAHLALGHCQGRHRWHLAIRAATLLAAVLGGAAMAGGLPWWPTLAALALAVAFVLSDARTRRHEEYAADVLSAKILTHIGHDGYRMVTTTLECIPQDPVWYRAGGWLLGSHPTPRARARRLAKATPESRRRLADVAGAATAELEGAPLVIARVLAGLSILTALGALLAHARFAAMFGLGGIPALIVFGGVGVSAVLAAIAAARGRFAPLPVYLAIAITAALTTAAALSA
ncbi:M48 family metalloprotease [Nonomuraea sp. NPDC005650]|uniref:M48 family metalloprotease n=1 Tax=Nonomuraea sp. NPDC005650 TaxID=3157045 RepID=UPI0033B43961